MSSNSSASRRLLRRALSALWAGAKALQFRLPSAVVHPGVADDRFQAALAGRLFASTLTPGCRVLDAAPVLGTCAVLAASGAERVVAVEDDTARRRWLRLYEPPVVEIVEQVPLASSPPGRPAEGEDPEAAGAAYDVVLEEARLGASGVPEQAISRIQRATSLLAPRGSLILWRGGSRSLAAVPQEPWNEVVEESLAENFVTVDRYWLVTPPGYRAQWQSRMPARARASEYRIVPATGVAPAGEELVDCIWVARNPRRHLPPGPLRLHVGSGDEALTGWVNLDILPFSAVDVVLDVAAHGLPFTGAEAVYAEHFLEHLEIDAALRFLAAAHGSLRDGGVLRLSTPSLDWTWRTLYRPRDRELAAADVEAAETTVVSLREAACADAIALNRSFYGWKHRFLWNRAMLERALGAVGFVDLEWVGRGESSFDFLRGIERHEGFDDQPEEPHVLTVEARKGPPKPEALERMRGMLEHEFLTPLRYFD